ncbi:MAG: F0F1 ATP synthase subunit delta [Chloroflexota bacterium]|nr:F0F1 ATP synthase subunit delta [Chloroflexota bacterium]
MLNLDWATIAFQTINFLALAGALYYLVFRPMMSRIRERRAEKRELMEQAREDREEAERLRNELEARLSEAEAEADEIITEAQKRADAERQQMLEEVEEEIERMLADAREDVHQIRQQAVGEFHDELIDAVMDVSAMVIGQAAPPDVHDKLVQQLADRIWEMGREEMERVRAFRQSLGERMPTAHVTTAHPLSSEQQGELARTFTALADRNVDIQVETDPDLAAGMRVRIGDIVVNNSIAGRLEELRGLASESLEERLTDERPEGE